MLVCMFSTMDSSIVFCDTFWRASLEKMIITIINFVSSSPRLVDHWS